MKIKSFILTVIALSYSSYILNEKTMSNLSIEDNQPVEENNDSLFNAAVELVKHFEGWHSEKHYPYVGYGHRMLPTDNFTMPITREQGDSILREDLIKRMKLVKSNFKTKLLLAMLSYNVGQSMVLGSKNRPQSKVAKMLLSGGSIDTIQLRKEYTSWRKWNGKVVKSIERRRNEEFNLIFK